MSTFGVSNSTSASRTSNYLSLTNTNQYPSKQMDQWIQPNPVINKVD